MKAVDFGVLEIKKGGVGVYDHTNGQRVGGGIGVFAEYSE